MAGLTPKEILDISEPIEAIYQRTADELLINIARHFEISGWERTRYWEIKKLSEMGALTKESAAIIAKNTQMLPEEIEKAFLQVSEKACLDVDVQLRDAAKKGILQDPLTTPATSPLMRDMVQAYVDQAVDKTNMVNTTMLESTRQAYLQGITTAVSEAQLLEAKQVLEVGAFSVTTGVETRTMAIRKAMNQLAQTGITGYYDRAGRKWSAEAYASMVVRTTSHNAAIMSIRTRQKEYGGGDTFQVSTHNGARPLCYPYQGKFYSWTGSGIFTDGAGREHPYSNIEDTSYGEPAGLFGINCGHHPIPMINGYSYPQEGPTQDEEANRKEYEEAQTQRAYEREIREAKRDLEIAKATGDEEAIKAASDKVAQKQANMRAYTKETGRPRRYDREQIANGKIPEGYRGYKQERKSDIPIDKEPQKSYTKKTFTDATTIKDAEEYARSLGLKVSYKNIDLSVANSMNEAFMRGLDYCPKISEHLRAVGSGQAINREYKEAVKEYYLREHTSTLQAFNVPQSQWDKYATKFASKTVGRIDSGTYAFSRTGSMYSKSTEFMRDFNGVFVNEVFGKDLPYFLENLQDDVNKKFHPVGCDTVKSVFDHEIAHQIDKAVQLKTNTRMLNLYNSLTPQEIKEGLSGYGTRNIGEFIAEGYAEYLNNPQPRKIAQEIMAIIEEAVGK